METGEPRQLTTGPHPLPEDSWDAGTGSLFVGGGREIRRHRMPRRYILAAVIVAAALLGVGIAVPVLLSGGGDTAHGPFAGGPVTSDPAASGSASASPVPSTTTVDQPAVVPAPASQPPPFEPITIEAEAGMPRVKLRSAMVVELSGASGGRGVRFSGDSGSIEFRQLLLPSAGTYRVTIFYSGAGAWTGELRGASAVTVTLGGATVCCATSTADVSLSPAGSLHLDVSAGEGERPAIDRIVIYQP